MTTVEVVLPDDLARDAKQYGLLAPELFELFLRERLHAARLERSRQVRAILAADPPEPMSNEELNAEIAADRAEQRRAASS
jgi:hypothetical protein